MEENKQHFQHTMLHYFRKGKNASEMQKKVCAVYGEDAVTDQMCQKWLVKFCAGGFSVYDALGRPVEDQSVRPVEVYSDQIETLIENNQYYTTQRWPTYSKYPNQ